MMRARELLLGLPLLAIACGGKTAEDTTDACTTCGDTGAVDAELPDVVVTRPDVGPDLGPPPPIDAGPPPTDCLGPADPTNPPIVCGPAPGIPTCKSTSDVSTCPADSACMARVKPASGAPLDFRMGRLRLYAPAAMLSLAPLAIDPNMNPVCENHGAESLNWMLRFDTSTKTLVTGSAQKSSDGGATFPLSHGSIDASAVSSICPGFAGPPVPIALDPVSVPFSVGSDGSLSTGLIPKLAIPIWDGAVPIILPLSQLSILHTKASADGACIGAWSRDYWCDGDTLGWTTGGAVLAKILVEDADHVPLKTAGCQSLCAILVNDSSKVTGKLCKRGADGKIPPIGDATVTTPGDAFLLSATFAAYGVKIVP